MPRLRSVGLIAEREPIAVGGVGDIWVFRKA